MIELEAGWDWQEIKGLAAQNKIGTMKPPFCPKGPVAIDFKQQMIIADIKDEANDIYKTYLFKHIVFVEKVRPEVYKAIIHGTPMLVNWGGNTKGGPKAFQYMLDKLGGLQIRYFIFDNNGTDHNQVLDTEVDAAYDFLQTHGPRTNGRSENGERRVWRKVGLGNSGNLVAV